MRVLIVEDDLVIAENLEVLLKHNHYIVDKVRTVDEGLAEISTGDYDIAIIDWMLPDGTGIEICKEVRSENNKIPIIMLTAKTQTNDIVQGLEDGADEYITKPYKAPELLARMHALLRRKDANFLYKELTIGNVSINTNLRTVKTLKKQIDLSPKEYELLEYLFRHKGESVDRLTLLAHIWGGSIDTFSNTVDVHIRYLRKKLGKDADIIKTVKGAGYCACEN